MTGERRDSAWVGLCCTCRAGAEIVDHFVDLGHGMLLAVAPLMDVARVGGLTDDEVAAVYEFYEERRASDYARFIGWLVDAQALRVDLSIQKATDVALTVLGPEAYLVLAARRRWEPDGIRESMREALKRLLLND